MYGNQGGGGRSVGVTRSRRRSHHVTSWGGVESRKDEEMSISQECTGSRETRKPVLFPQSKLRTTGRSPRRYHSTTGRHRILSCAAGARSSALRWSGMLCPTPVNFPHFHRLQLASSVASDGIEVDKFDCQIRVLLAKDSAQHNETVDEEQKKKKRRKKTNCNATVCPKHRC